MSFVHHNMLAMSKNQPEFSFATSPGLLLEYFPLPVSEKNNKFHLLKKKSIKITQKPSQDPKNIASCHE